jgi:hypothetical protein
VRTVPEEGGELNNPAAALNACFGSKADIRGFADLLCPHG